MEIIKCSSLFISNSKLSSGIENESSGARARVLPDSSDRKRFPDVKNRPGGMRKCQDARPRPPSKDEIAKSSWGQRFSGRDVGLLRLAKAKRMSLGKEISRKIRLSRRSPDPKQPLVSALDTIFALFFCASICIRTRDTCYCPSNLNSIVISSVTQLFTTKMTDLSDLRLK